MEFITVCNFLTNPDALLDYRYSVEHKRSYLQQNHGNLLSKISLSDKYRSGRRKLDHTFQKGICLPSIVLSTKCAIRLISVDCRCQFVFGATAPQWAIPSSFTRFLDHTLRRTTFGRTPLDEGSARRRDLYLTIHDTHNKRTSMPQMRFEPTVSAGERPQTCALDRAAVANSADVCY